jgi:hypothetical protein
MASWGSVQTETKNSITTTEQTFAAIELLPNQRLDAMVDVDFQVTPTEDAVVSVYTQHDDSGDQVTDKPIWARLLLASDGDENIPIPIIQDRAEVVIGVKMAAGSETITSAILRYRIGTP